jgi:hypothetical protein
VRRIKLKVDMDYIKVALWAICGIGLGGYFVWCLMTYALIGGMIHFGVPFICGLLLGKQIQEYSSNRRIK